MDAATIIFYLLAAMTLGSALLAVTSRQIFRSAIYLLFSLIGIAGIYFWLDYAFIAAVQIVVYVGGIVVLIIFSIFLTQQAGEDLPKPKWTQQLFAALAAFCGFALVLVQVLQYGFTEVTQTGTAEVDRIGRLMLSTGEGGMAFPFELVSVLLLAAMIGCIVIAMRKPEEQRNNRTEEQ